MTLHRMGARSFFLCRRLSVIALNRINHIALRHIFISYLGFLMAA